MPINTAGMKKMWLNRLHVMLNVKVFATQAGWPVGQMNTTHNIDPYDVHMNQKKDFLTLNYPHF